jgi:hypothetical protein
MRVRNIYLFVLALLAFPSGTYAQQGPVPSDKKPVQKDWTSIVPPPAENWRVLNDLKTGLLLPDIAVVQHDEQPDFVRELVRVQWRRADPIDLWIIRPKIAEKVPVVLYLYSYTDTDQRFRDNGWCKRASSDGFAAVGFVSALTDYRFRAPRPMRQWFVSELSESLGSSVHDVQLILNYLAGRGDIDMDHVGMFGMGSGATIAILAAHADSRIKALDLLDPWGDWPEWLELSPVVPDADRSKFLTPEFLKSVATLDPVTYLPSLKPQSLRLQQTLSEPITPRVAKDRIAAAVPNPSQLVKYANPEDLLKEWRVTGLSGWLKQQLHSPRPNDVAARVE